MTKLRPRPKKDRQLKRRKAFIKIIKQHYPDCHVSFNPPHGSACNPVLLTERDGEPVSPELMQRAARGAKIAPYQLTRR